MAEESNWIVTLGKSPTKTETLLLIEDLLAIKLLIDSILLSKELWIKSN